MVSHEIRSRVLVFALISCLAATYLNVLQSSSVSATETMETDDRASGRTSRESGRKGSGRKNTRILAYAVGLVVIASIPVALFAIANGTVSENEKPVPLAHFNDTIGMRRSGSHSRLDRELAVTKTDLSQTRRTHATPGTLDTVVADLASGRGTREFPDLNDPQSVWFAFST